LREVLTTPKSFAGFVCRFLILYLVFSPPWAGWDGIYGSFFRAFGTAVFVRQDDGGRELEFKTPGADSPRPLDTRIEIANRALLHADGSGPVRDFDIDARAFAWDPMALFAALVLATPIPMRRKLNALLIGTLCLNAIIMMGLAFCIWKESAEISLAAITPFWRPVVDAVSDFVITQTRLALPPLIWILTTFRKEDWACSPANKSRAVLAAAWKG